jgi:hypothetical protein
MVVGILLIAVSAYPLFLMTRENILESQINSKYEVKQVINIRNEGQAGKPIKSSHDLAFPIEWEGNIIEVLTKDTGVNAPKTIFDKESKHIMNMIIKINGKEVSSPTEAWLSPNLTKDSDYLSWLNIVKIKNDKSNMEQIAIIQRLTGDWEKGKSIKQHTQSQKWRILHVDKNKQVSEEVFSYPERGEHLLGVKLVQLSSQSDSLIGYKSDISYYLPNIFFPLAYPTGTCLIGIVLLVIGIIRYIKSK